MTHTQAKECFTALTKDGDSNSTLQAQWAVFRLLLEMGGDSLYERITGKPIEAEPTFDDEGKPVKRTAVPVRPAIPISTNPNMGTKSPG